MKIPLASGAARWTALVVSLLAGFPLSYFGLRNARAQYFAAQKTPESVARAIETEPGNPEHWYLLGRYWHYNFEAQDIPRAVSYYQHAIALDHYSARTWLDLGTAYEAEGRGDDASRAYLEAHNAYPISPIVAWQYGNFLLRQGQTSAAYAEFRRAIQTDPKMASLAVSRCWRSSGDLNAILTEVLPATPEAYLEALRFFALERESDAALTIWRRLAAVAPQVPLRVSFPLFDLLLAAERTADARAVWDQARALAKLGEPPATPSSLVWDGGFETDFTGGGFGWRSVERPGIRADIDTEIKHSGARALRIRFDGSANFDFQDVTQYVAVEPRTAYRFSCWLRAEGISTDSGVRLFVYDPHHPAASSGLTPDVLGSEPWTRFEFTVVTGKDTHVLLIGPRRSLTGKLDNKLRGTVWVDDVALEPLSSPVKAP